MTRTGLHVLPGLIDPHVHLRDPGDKSVETIPTGTKAAVLGGLAAVFDMPNTSPLDHRCRKTGVEAGLRGSSAWCDMGLYVGGTKTNIPELAALELGRGVCGVKIFAGSSTGDLMIEDDEHLELAMRSGPPPHRLSQRGRIPPAGTQADVQVGRSVHQPHGLARRGDAPSSAPAG